MESMDPQQIPVQTQNTSNTGYIILIILIILLLAAAIIFLALWLTKNTKGREVDLPDEKIDINTDTAITVTWDGDSNVFGKDDEVQVFGTTDSDFKIKNGVVTTKSGKKVDSSSKVAASSGSAGLSGLESNKITNVISVVTAPDTNVHTSNTQLIFTQSSAPTEEMQITPLGLGTSSYLGFEFDSNPPVGSSLNNCNGLDGDDLGTDNIALTSQLKIYNTANTTDNGNKLCGLHAVPAPSSDLDSQSSDTGTSQWLINTSRQLVSDCGGRKYYITKDAEATTDQSAAVKWIYKNNNWCLESSTPGTATTSCLIVKDPSTTTPDVSVSTISSTPEILDRDFVNQRWANITK